MTQLMHTLAQSSSGHSKDIPQLKKQTGWLNKAVSLASALLRNDQTTAKKIASHMSDHEVAGPLIKKHMDSHEW